MSEEREPYIITAERLDLIEAAAQPNDRGLMSDRMTLGLCQALRQAWQGRDEALGRAVSDELEFNMLHDRCFEQGVQLGRCDAAFELIIAATSLSEVKKLARKLRKELQQEARGR